MPYQRVVCLALFTASLWAAPVGSIKGFVRDASGAVVPNAILTLSNEKTGVRQKTVSDAAAARFFS